mmetsp:Transcript_1024/g.2443  ORF Transcript_1024/g.2443 Transcript_1024/m.2443 type:complete len:204 (+) Transcript_1024:1238-1849(+)
MWPTPFAEVDHRLSPYRGSAVDSCLSNPPKSHPLKLLLTVPPLSPPPTATAVDARRPLLPGSLAQRTRLRAVARRASACPGVCHGPRSGSGLTTATSASSTSRTGRTCCGSQQTRLCTQTPSSPLSSRDMPATRKRSSGTSAAPSPSSASWAQNGHSTRPSQSESSPEATGAFLGPLSRFALPPHRMNEMSRALFNCVPVHFG